MYNSQVLEIVLSYIENQITDYFVELESKAKKNIRSKKISYKKIFLNLINKEELNSFIALLYKNLNTMLGDLAVEVSEQSINIDKITNFKINRILINEYENTQLISKLGEDIFNELTEDKFNLFLYAKLFNKDFADMALTKLNLSVLSSPVLIKKHNGDLEKRVQGILINAKYRLIRIIKNQVVGAYYMNCVKAEMTA